MNTLGLQKELVCKNFRSRSLQGKEGCFVSVPNLKQIKVQSELNEFNTSATGPNFFITDSTRMQHRLSARTFCWTYTISIRY